MYKRQKRALPDTSLIKKRIVEMACEIYQIRILRKQVEKTLVIEIAPDSPHHINPMDIDLSFDEENPMALKADFILSLMELIVGGKDGLQPVERTVIDRCVRQMYREHLQDPETSKMPTLQTLYDLLCSQPEGEAVRLATALEIYD